jgi:hypothetical protein
MTIQELGSIGEFVGALAVLLSLVYLAYQIRQNTRSVRASTHHTTAHAAYGIQHLIAESETVARIWLTGAREPQKLTREERARFDAIMRSFFMWYEDTYFQYRNSMIGRDVWEARQESMMGHLRDAGILSWWSKNSHIFTESFVSYVGQLLEERGRAAQSDEAERP